MSARGEDRGVAGKIRNDCDAGHVLAPSSLSARKVVGVAARVCFVSSHAWRRVGLREITGGSLWVCSKKEFDSKLCRGPQTRDICSIKVTSKIALLRN